MTLPPERIGDKGQRYQITYSAYENASDERCLGYAETLEDAQRMAASWRLRPEHYFVWVVDRQVPAIGSALHRLLPHALKPEEIEGPEDVREARAAELVRWFARHAEGHANPKWFEAHAYELAAYVARQKTL